MIYLLTVFLLFLPVIHSVEFPRNFKMVVESKLQSTRHKHTRPNVQHIWRDTQKEKICALHSKLAQDKLTFCRLTNVFEVLQGHLNWHVSNLLKAKWQTSLHYHYYQLDPWLNNPYRTFLRDKLLDELKKDFFKRIPATLAFTHGRQERDEFFTAHEKHEKLLAMVKNKFTDGCYVRISPASYIDFQPSASVYIESFKDSISVKEAYTDTYLEGISFTISKALQMPGMFQLLEKIKQNKNNLVLSHISIPRKYASWNIKRTPCNNSWQQWAHKDARNEYLEDPSLCIAQYGANYYFLDFKPEFAFTDSGLEVHNFLDNETEKSINYCLIEYNIPVLPTED